MCKVSVRRVNTHKVYDNFIIFPLNWIIGFVCKRQSELLKEMTPNVVLSTKYLRHSFITI